MPSAALAVTLDCTHCQRVLISCKTFGGIKHIPGHLCIAAQDFKLGDSLYGLLICLGTQAGVSEACTVQDFVMQRWQVSRADASSCLRDRCTNIIHAGAPTRWNHSHRAVC